MANDIAPPIEVEQAEELKAVVTLPLQSRLLRQAAAFLQMVKEYTIDSPDTYQHAANDRNDINERYKEIEKEREFMKAPSLEQGRRIDAHFKPVTTTLLEARKLLDGKIASYSEEQERQRQEAARLAREQQERDAAAKREQAAKEEAEAKAKADELRRKAAEAEAKGNAGQAAKLAAKAENAEQAGAQKAADLNTQAALAASMPVAIAASAPKADGIGIGYDYSAEVTDLMELMRHVVSQRPDLVALFKINEPALNSQARSLKDALNLPGVKLKKTPRVRDSRR